MQETDPVLSFLLSSFTWERTRGRWGRGKEQMQGFGVFGVAWAERNTYLRRRLS